MTVTFHHTTLPNGLTILAETDPQAHTVAVGFFVRTGARDEDPALMGVSHFLEHMLFKGTDRRTAEDINREFDRIGANYNAFTSHETTVFFAQVLPEFLPQALDILADMMRPALRPEDFELERQVILEEIGMCEDRPTWQLQDRLREQFFDSHPLGYRILGTRQTISQLTVQQMRDYHRQRYSSDNILVAAAGRLDFSSLAQNLARLTESWQPSGFRRSYPPLNWTPRQILDTQTKLTRHYLAAACPAPSAQDDLRYAASVLAAILGDGDSSRLHWALVENGLADEASLSFEPQDRCGLFVASASCDPDRRHKVRDILLETLARYRSSIDPEEIQRTKHRLATNLVLQGELPMGRMTSLGGTWLYLGRYRSLEQELASLMAVDRSQIQSLLDRWPLDRWTILEMGPSPA